MSSSDKARNTGEGLKGKAKEATGRVTGDRDMEAEGKADQISADLKQAGEKLKDATGSVLPNGRGDDESRH